MKEKEQEVICLNGISAIGMQELLDYAYTSTLTLTSGNKEYFLLFLEALANPGREKNSLAFPLSPGWVSGVPSPHLDILEISTLLPLY